MATTTALTPYPLALPVPVVRFLAVSWWTCSSAGTHTRRNRSDALLAPGQPLSVVPFTIRNNLDLEVYPVPGWRHRVPSWYGVSCRIGRVTLWLPIVENPGQLRSFSLLALLPQQDLPDAPPFIQLGAQFLIEYRVQALLDGENPSNSRLLIP
jgi:hypothetical protein